MTHFLKPSLLAMGITLAGTLPPITSASDGPGQPLVSSIDRQLAARDWLAALAEIERALAQSPDDPALYRLRVFTLADIGASHRAWTLYRERPELFEADARARLEAARLARQVNWSQLYTADEVIRLDEAEATAADFARFRAVAPAAGLEVPRNTPFDELIVLNQLGRHQEVIDTHERLRAQGLETPGYVLGTIGDSLLALRRPGDAAAVLERAMAADPDDRDVPVQLAYAHLERERADLALELLGGLVGSQAPWPRAPGGSRGYENWHRYDAEVNYALVRAYAEDPAGAQATLEPMASVGPGNGHLHAALGTVYLLRGWPERALERFRVANTLDARDVGARVGQVDALRALQLPDRAGPLRDDLLTRFPAEPRVMQMERDWQLHRRAGARLYAASARNLDDIDPSPLGSRDAQYGIDVHGPLLDDRWRLLARSDHRWADYEDRRVRIDRYDVGVRYAYDRLSVDVSAGRATDAVGGTGVDVELGWRIDDAWRAGVELRRNDANASLHARASGISANSASASVAYRRSESTAVSVSAQRWRYDDGNRRDMLAVAADQRLVGRAHLLVHGFASLGASRASRDDAPYFNPSRDASLDLGLRIDHVGWRHYERHFRQRMTLAAGRYRQLGFGTEWVPSVRYEHEWRLAPGRVLLYGIGWSRPVYDGQRESRLGFDAELRWGE